MITILSIKSRTKSHSNFLLICVYPNNSNENKKFHSVTYIGKHSEKVKSICTKASFCSLNILHIGSNPTGYAGSDRLLTCC